MGSPAKVLAELLQSVLEDSLQTELFPIAVAQKLGQHGSQNALMVLARVLELIDESHQMIALLSASDTQKGLVANYLTPLEPLRNFSVFHYRVKDAKDSFLNPSTIQNLLLLDVMLSSVSKHPAVSEEARKEVEVLTSFMDHIHDLDIPQPMKEALLGRMIQMLDILNHFEFFGEKNLEDKIDALLGKLTLAAKAVDETGRAKLHAVVQAVAKIGAGIIFANNVASGYLALTQSLPKILSLPSPDEPSKD